MGNKIVFISYSHDSPEHKARVLGLSERLRDDGIETRLDQYLKRSPGEGWPRWMLNEIEDADQVLVVCTQTYYERFRGRGPRDRGRGSDWEGAIITQALYDSYSINTKFIPVVMNEGDKTYIPEPLRGGTCYKVTVTEEYEELYDVLMEQAGVEPGPVGTPRLRPRSTGEPLVLVERAGGELTQPNEPLQTHARVDPREPRQAAQTTQAAPPEQARWSTFTRRPGLPRRAVAGAAVLLVLGGTAAVAARVLDRSASGVAVLPLRYVGAEDGAGVAEGFTRELIGILNKVDGLRPPGGASVMKYLGTAASPGAAAGMLEVGHVLEGTVSTAGPRLRFDLRLRNRRNQEVWKHTYDEPFSRVFEVERRIARDVAEALDVSISDSAVARLDADPTRSWLAYAAYVRGRGRLYRGTNRQAHNEEAVALFTEARRLDPGYGLAYAGLARAYEERSHRVGQEAWYDSALAAGERAVQLAPNDERAHASLGYVQRAGGRLQDALLTLRRAAAMRPAENDASGRSNLGLVELERGRADLAVAAHQRATDLEPGSATARMRLGMAYQALGDADRAQREYEEAIQIDSLAAEPLARLALLYWMQGRGGVFGDRLMRRVRSVGEGDYHRFEWAAYNGRWAEARRAWEAWRRGEGRDLRAVPPLLALVYLRLNDTASARAALDSAQREQQAALARGHEGATPHLLLAQVFALRGDVGAANQAFSRAVERGYLDVLAAERHPAFVALLQTAEFQQSLRTIRQRAEEQRRLVAAE